MPPGAELARLLDDFEPAELALRDWVRTRMNASLVRELACADYGMDADEHQAGIEELLVARRLPAELDWRPREVLQLSSHSVPAGADGGPGSAGWRGHVVRLFCCLVLVRADDAAEPAETLAGLVESALELGPEATGPALRYLAWCRLHEPGTWRYEAEAVPFLTLGLLLLYVRAPGRGDPAVADELARTFVGEVGSLLEWETPAALLRATARGSGWRSWRALIDRCLASWRQAPASVELVRTWAGVSGPR